ncbi:MAG: hypothetical protein IT292_03675 [Deltaproteobacteria bacterium]|nr:hypothetical protein [Deltaproteobacteria bacterium]
MEISQGGEPFARPTMIEVSSSLGFYCSEGEDGVHGLISAVCASYPEVVDARLVKGKYGDQIAVVVRAPEPVDVEVYACKLASAIGISSDKISVRNI